MKKAIFKSLMSFLKPLYSSPYYFCFWYSSLGWKCLSSRKPFYPYWTLPDSTPLSFINSDLMIDLLIQQKGLLPFLPAPQAQDKKLSAAGTFQAVCQASNTSGSQHFSSELRTISSELFHISLHKMPRVIICWVEVQ